MWRYDCYFGQIFFTSERDRIQIGIVQFNCIPMGLNTTPVYAGDFDGDGDLEIGYAPGWVEYQPEPEPEPEPEHEPEKQPEKQTSTKNCQKKSCFKIELDFKLIIQGCLNYVKQCCNCKK